MSVKMLVLLTVHRDVENFKNKTLKLVETTNVKTPSVLFYQINVCSSRQTNSVSPLNCSKRLRRELTTSSVSLRTGAMRRSVTRTALLTMSVTTSRRWGTLSQSHSRN